MGGSGNVSILGGTGNDLIDGGTGDDTITGGSGDDTITGGSGNDVIVGGTGNDSIVGGSGSDSIVGGSGNDIIYGGLLSSTITGGSGNDTIVGGNYNDIIYGGTGNDSIEGGYGAESIVGGSGNDVLIAGNLSSTITGGSGDDLILGGYGNDIIDGGTGNDSIYAGTGNDSIVGGSGDDIIYGYTGDSTISGGTGNVTISAGGGNDVLSGDGFNSWLMFYGSTNMTLTNTTFSTSGGSVSASVSEISGFQHAILAAGTGDFTLDASGFSGSAILQGGTGNDTLIGASGPDTLEGGSGNDSLVGGGGGDTFAFNGGSSGSQTIFEPPGSPVAGLDFSQAPAGISINLSQSGPQAVMPATMGDGALTLTLADPLAIDSVLGSSYDDTIIGNTSDDTLIGGGGDNVLAGVGGNNLIEGTVTRTVYLDFDTYELPGQHDYTQAERDAIQAQITADYSAFSYIFTQTQPQSGPYTAIIFNDPALVGLEGGISSEIDWRDLDISGTTTLTADGLEVIPPDSGGVNVNNFLGGPGEPAATSADFIGLSATIAAHELGHLSGLEHADAFGPIGAGIYAGVNPDLYNPPYPGPTDADEAIVHIMASGASVNATLEDAINDPFFGERESIALSYGANGSPTNEQIAPHESMSDAQPLALQPLVVPDTDLEGEYADTVFDVTAADVVGYLGETSGASNTDFYSFTAQAGTLINFQLMSAALTRSVADPGTPPSDYNQGPFDTSLTIYDSSGQVIASNDDSFQDSDSSIIDLTLPTTGTYYAMVTSSPKSVSLSEPLTGDYELFMYTFATGADPPAGDTMYAGSGDDTIIAGSADDTIAAQPQDLIVYGSGTVTTLPAASSLNVSAGSNQSVNEASSVTLTGSVVDSSGSTTSVADWHVFASSGQQIADGTGPTFTFTPGNAGTYTVTYEFIDPSVGWDSGDVVITSQDVPPVLTAPGTSQSAFAGQSTSINLGTLALTGIGPFTETVQWGDGQTSTFSPKGSEPLSLDHTYTAAGTYTIGETVSEYDGGTATTSVAISIAQELTSTSLTSSTASAVYGQSLTFTATVAGPGAPTGTVMFYAGPVTPADQIGSGTLIFDNGQYQATFSTSALSASGSPYAITAVYGGDAGNQGSPSNVVTETITKASAVILVTPYIVTDDGNPHTATGTATGVETPTPANLSGLLDLSGTTHTDVGTYTDTWTFAGNGNYISASGTITDVITQPLTVTAIAAISPNPRTTPVSTVDVTFNVPIETSSPTAGAVTLTDNGNPVVVSGVSFTLVPDTTSTYQVGDLSAFTAAGGSYMLTVTAADIDDQNGTAGSGSLSTSWLVTGTTPTISWADPAAIVYGTALSETQLDATANVPGMFTYTPAAGTVLSAGNNQTLSVFFTPTDTTDYTSAVATATINVSPATPTIGWSNPADIVFGTALDGTQLDATSSWTVGDVNGSVAGTFTYSLAAGTVLGAGNNQPLSILFTPADMADYTTASATATINVSPATPTISWSNPADIVFGTALSGTQLDASSSWTVGGVSGSVAGTFTYSLAAGTVLGAGTNQPLSVLFTPADMADYTTASASVTINVSPATPTISWSNPADIVFGTALDGTQLDATSSWTIGGMSGSVAGTFAYSLAAGTVLGAGNNQPLSVFFTPTDTSDYTTASASVTINVSPATPTISWSNPADIVFGTALDGTQLDATSSWTIGGVSGSVAGSFTYSLATGTVLGAGNNQPLSVLFTPTDMANYTTASASVTINVSQATPTISWSNPADIVFGTALDGTQLDATSSWTIGGMSGSVAGTLTYNLAAGTVLGAGNNQPLSVFFTPTDTSDFTTASASVTINVSPATPTISWSNPADITFGTALSGTQLDATSFWTVGSVSGSVAGTFTYSLAAGTVLGAGNNQPLSVLFTPTDTSDYTTASATATINVSPATPTISWSNPADIVFGTALSGTQLDAASSWRVGDVSGSVAGTFTYTPAAGTVLRAGTNQTLSVSFTPTDATDYTTAGATVTINVLPPTQTSVYVASEYAGDAPGTQVTWTDGSTHTVGVDAFGTIQAGINAVAASGTVDVASGAYTEQLTIDQSLSLVGAGASSTTIQASASLSGSEIEIASGVSVTMSGLSVDGASTSTAIDVNGGELSASSLAITGYNVGISVENAGAVTVSDSTISSSTTGILVGFGLE